MTTCKFCSSDLTANICGASIRNPINGEWDFMCTRPQNHEGDHVACGTQHDVGRRKNLFDASAGSRHK